MMHNRPRVVIIGAGFAGLQAAQKLSRTPVAVTLIDRKNYHTFQPLLHQVATAELEPEQIAYPIRALLRQAKNVQFIMADVQQIRLEEQVVITDCGAVAYDFLVIATGSTAQFLGVPGAATHAFSLKAVEDAIALHDQILRCFEGAMQEPDPERQRQLLTFVIVGGGATGVELAGALAEWVRRSLIKDYARLNCQQMRLVLVHSGTQLLNGMQLRLQTYAQRQLQHLGVEVHLNTRVTAVQPDGVTFQSGEVLKAQTVVWVTGVRSSVPSTWNLPLTPQQQVSVLPTLQVVGQDQVYAIGDIAAFRHKGQALPLLAAVAVQQGQAIARNIHRQIQGQPPLRFHYRDGGRMAILSRHAAVVQLGRWAFTGFSAWLLWLTIHVLLLRGVRQRWLTLLNWLSNYCFRERVARVILQPAPLKHNPNFVK